MNICAPEKKPMPPTIPLCDASPGDLVVLANVYTGAGFGSCIKYLVTEEGGDPGITIVDIEAGSFHTMGVSTPVYVVKHRLMLDGIEGE